LDANNPTTKMHLQLEGKTALVSGSSQGIGFAIAEALAREGATVVINSYKQELVE
jgi:NAD(P)-dependent dehydrogenase (short-subunit alcohol dehydrogenase family)